MPNYCGTPGAEAFSNETCRDCWGGEPNREGQEPRDSLPAHPPLRCWSGSRHSPGDPLGEEQWFREEMPRKNGERRKASASTSLPAVGSVLLLRLDVPFPGCLLPACKAKPYVWGNRLALGKVGAKGQYAIGVWSGRRNLLIFKTNQCTAWKNDPLP